MRVLTSDETRAAEREACTQQDISTLVLMQRAGTAVAQFCAADFQFESVCVVCGKGNNGGDGLVAAEALRRVAKVSVLILAPNVTALSPDAAAMCQRLKVEPVWINNGKAFDSDAVRQALQADLIIDAIFGTGFKPPLRDLAKRAVHAINDAFGKKVSVDLPSGIDADIERSVLETTPEMVFANGIVTMIAPKPAHVFGDLTVGPIAVSEIGAPPPAQANQTGLRVITGEEVGLTFPPRARTANKGTFGHVLVIAGSLGKAGAAGLAGMAALRTGAGLVTVACPKSIQTAVAGFAPELMTEGLAETSDGTIAIEAMSRLESLLKGKDAVVMGPGLSQNPETADLVRQLVPKCSLPLVLDADGLNAFDGHYDLLRKDLLRKAELTKSGDVFRVFTPHPGEAARLIGASIKEIQASRREMARRIAGETGACVVLKGSRTIVAGASGETWINMTGNPAMAKGGTGDVLSGIIGAALAGPEARYEPDPQPPKGLVKIDGADPADSQAGLPESTREREGDSDRARHYMKDEAVAAAVHLHGLAGDYAADMLHEQVVLASDLIRHLSEGFRDCERQFDRDLFYLQK